DAPVATDSGGAGDAAPDAEPEAVRGTVVVDGVSYDMTTMRNCEPFEVEGIDVALELQGLGEHDGERVQVDVYIQTIGGMPSDDVSWAGPEGVYGGSDDAAVTLDEAAGRVVGTATLKDSLTQTETIGIEFDLEVPAE